MSSMWSKSLRKGSLYLSLNSFHVPLTHCARLSQSVTTPNLATAPEMSASKRNRGEAFQPPGAFESSKRGRLVVS